MNPIFLNVVGQVTKNKGVYFLETIKINSNRVKTDTYLFDYLHQPITLHPKFEKNLNFKKGKQLVYITLEADEVEIYFEISTQKFKFQDTYLQPQSIIHPLVYNKQENPIDFIDKFKKENAKFSDTVKVTKLCELITSEDKQVLLPKAIKGFDTFCEAFTEFYSPKHLEYRKNLYICTDVSNLSRFVEKKLEYFRTLSSFKFEHILEIIKMSLNKEQTTFLNTMKLKNESDLIAASKLFEEAKSINTRTTSNLIGYVMTPTYTFSSINRPLDYTQTMEYSICNTGNLIFNILKINLIKNLNYRYG